MPNTKINAQAKALKISSSVQTASLQYNMGKVNKASKVPAIVHEVPHAPGQLLDTHGSAFLGAHSGHSFSQFVIYASEESTDRQTIEPIPKQSYSLGGVCQIYPSGTQTKLIVSQPNDAYEQEANQVAEHIMGVRENGFKLSVASSLSPTIQRRSASQELPPEGSRQMHQHLGQQASQLHCVIKRGGCPTSSRPAGYPSSEEIRQYNELCRKESGYSGPDILPECKFPGTEEEWSHIYSGTEHNELEDYVVAGISLNFAAIKNDGVELVKPKSDYTPPVGWDLDCLIRRNGSARKFRGIFGFLPFHIGREELTPNQTKEVFSQYINQATELFANHPQPETKSIKNAPNILQRATANFDSLDSVPPIVQNVLSSSGRSLDTKIRDFFEPRFGYDFSQVRVHTDTKAVESAQAVNALAYTVGYNVVFGAGQYQPETSEGKRLLAHELTHVIQQRGSAMTPQFRLNDTRLSFTQYEDQAEKAEKQMDQEYPSECPSSMPQMLGTGEGVPSLQCSSRTENYATAVLDTGPVWDVELSVTGTPEEPSESVDDFVDACIDGIGQALASFAHSPISAMRQIRIQIQYQQNFDYGVIVRMAMDEVRKSYSVFRHSTNPTQNNMGYNKLRPSTRAAAISTMEPSHTVLDFEDQEIKGTVARQGPVTIEKTKGLTKRHRELRGRAPIPSDKIEPFLEANTIQQEWERLISPNGISASTGDYKDRWVRSHRYIIKAAAQEFDIPDWLLAGVAWIEVGGEPPWTDDLSYILGALHIRGQAIKASYGPVAIQIVRAAEELGYSPQSLSHIQTDLIISSLRNPQQNLLIVASHLHRLKNIESPNKPAEMLTDDDIRIIGARYNRGAELSLPAILYLKGKTSYGDSIINKKTRLQALLKD